MTTTFRIRRKALDAKKVTGGLVLTKVQAQEKQADKVAEEIETTHRGYQAARACSTSAA